MSEEDDAFDIDMDDDDDLLGALAQSGRTRRIYVFESGSNDAERALRAAGIDAVGADLGSRLMSAAKDGDVLAVLVAAGTEEDLRELFMRAFVGKFADVPVLYLNGAPDNPQIAEQARTEGSRGLLAWPLPPIDLLVPQIEAHTDGPVPRIKVQSPSAPEMLPLSALTPIEPTERYESSNRLTTGEFKSIVETAATKRAENTELKSERTLARSRLEILQGRLDATTHELERLTIERDELRRQNAGPAKRAEVTELKRVLEQSEQFLARLNDGVAFFEELSGEFGEGAPLLGQHVRTLRLTRSLFSKLRDATDKL